MHKWCHSCRFWAGLEAFCNLYRCGLKDSILDTVLCLVYLPLPGKLLFHFPALPQISCVWPWASYYNPCGLESASCKPEIILPHPFWLCLYIRQPTWGTASWFLFVWQIVLGTTWSWTWLCHPGTGAWSIFCILPRYKRVTRSYSELALPCSESKMQVCLGELGVSDSGVLFSFK